MPSTPELVVVAAVADAPGRPGDRLIGDGLDLPWHLPADLKRFKAMTLGHPLVMGRRTFESLLHQFGGPLPGRETVVLTRHPEASHHPGIHVCSSVAAAIEAFPDAPTLFIGGGAAVYADVLGDGERLADRLELTLVEGDFTGDTFFPPYRHLLADNGGPFERAFSERHDAADGRPAFRFETFVRADRGQG
jgi:dihydrofolate reductase